MYVTCLSIDKSFDLGGDLRSTKQKQTGMKLGFIWLIVLCCLILQVSCVLYGEDTHLPVASDYEQRARIITVDGNIYFHAGSNKSITFMGRQDGSIFFDDIDIRSIPTKTELTTFSNRLAANNEGMQQIRRSNAIVERIFPTLRVDVSRLKWRYVNLLNLMKRMNDTKSRNRHNRRVLKLITTLTTQIDRLTKLIKTNECLTAPCKNGATCIDLFADYFCRTCSRRIDECRLYSGTLSGCLNGGTCINNKDAIGFTCNCTDKWHGPRCQYEHTACSQSPGICGDHGQCVDRNSGGGQGLATYDCICEWGYKKTNNPNNPTCVDIDECAAAPCFSGATCENLPGTFKCASCPPGYVGNGVNCADFDECESQFTNDCSKYPEVECINTIGSYTCGGCPKDFIGDGYTCTKRPFCDPNPCSTLATCQEHEKACLCPDGYYGDGRIDGNGCQESVYHRCPLTCQNGGSCRSFEDYSTNFLSAKCFCPLGFHGKVCEYVDRCVDSKYCNNRGVCKRNENDAVCECQSGYSGNRCQDGEVTACSIYTTNQTGVITFEPFDDGNSLCTWIIKLMDTRQVVELWFDWFRQNDTKEADDTAGRDILVINDNTLETGDLIGVYSTNKSIPGEKTPLYSSSNMMSMEYIHDNSLNGSSIQIRWKAADAICGTRLVQPEGHLEYRSRRAYENCIWYITVSAGYYLEVTVETVIMHSDQYINCSLNQLEVFDDSFLGEDKNRLMRLCQTENKATIRKLSGRNAVIRLHYNSYLSSDEQFAKCQLTTGSKNNTDNEPKCQVYFSIKYQSFKLPEQCGGEVKLFDPNAQGEVSGLIESPNYGHAYFPNLNCVWILDATGAFNNSLLDEMESVEIEFLSIDIVGGTNGSSCAEDRLVIASVDPNNGQVATNDDNLRSGYHYTICNENRPPRMQLHLGPKVQIQLITNKQIAGTGFQLKYRPICQQTIPSQPIDPTIGFNGTIQSPNLRAPSATPFKCHYRILTERHQNVRLRFDYIGLKRFSLECLHAGRNNVSYDYIEMSGGHSSNVHFNRRYYCSRYPFVAPRGEVIGTGTNHYDVIYSTSGDANNLGFQFFYEVTPIGCGAIFNDPSGRLTSPNFPENYPSHMFCVYDILQPNDGQGIRLTFDEFNVENVASRTDCGFDVVRIYEYFNNEKDHGKMLGEYCGIKVPPPLLTESNRLSLVFLSDRSVSGRGFSAHWDSVNLTLDCDRTFTEDSGVIEFNSTNYQRATSCSFKISLSDVNRIRLTVENMSLPCDVGKLMIRNGPDQLSPGFSGLQGNSEMCNTQMLQHLQSQGDTIYMRLNLKSSDPVYFRISYERIASSCGGYIYGFNGAISAPQYPEVDSRHLNCEWQIGTAHGNKIRLQFMRIDNLDSADSAGFCQPFARNYIDVTSSKSPDATIIKRYCRREASPMPIDSEDNNLVIRYNQNGGSIHGGLFGFLAQFTTLCEDIELTESDGVIQSPGFSHKVGEERECSWRIKTTPGARLKIVFSYFKIQDVSYRRYGTNGLECLSNYLEIDRTQINNTVGSVQGVQSLDMSNRRFCSWVAEPREIITKSNEFKLNFQSNGQTENHFWLTWSTVGCGGHVINNGSQILVNVTDFVPVSLSSRRRCDWVVHAPVGYVARVDIAELYTLAIVSDKGALCRRNQSNPNEFNGLEFYSGSVANNPEIDYAQQSYCGDIHNVSYFSHTNELLIRLDFNASQTQHLNDVVFRAKVSFVKPQLNNSCGGIVKIPINQNVTIRSPQYPKQYPRSIECVWQFETEPGYTISYNLSRYATPNQHARTKAYGIHRPVGNTRCSQALGYIEGSISFYAGEYNRQTFVGTGLATKDALQRICVDIDAPVLVDSHHNVSTVTFNGGPYEPSIASGDAAKVAIIGFELEVFATCGGTLTADSKRRVYPIRHNAHTNGSCHLRVERKEEVPIYVRFELVRFNQYADTNLALGIKGTCGGVTREYRQQSYTNLITMKCDGPLDFEVSNIPAELEFLVHYDTESDFCGGSLQAKVGMVNLGKLEGAVDCEYKLFMPEGNQVTVMIMNTYIEKSDYCAESFVEVREFNSTGKLMARLCGLIGFQQFRHSGLYVRIRRTTSLGALTVPMSSTTTSITVPDDDYTNEEDGAPSDVLSRDAKFSFLYTKEFGSSIIGTSGLIELPSHHESFVIRSFVYPAVAWQITGTESSYYIRLKFVRRFYVDLEIYDHFCDKDVCRASGTEPKYRLTDENPFDPADAGATTRVEEYVIESNAVTICISNVEKLSQMKVYWDQVPPDYANQTNGIQTEAGKSEFTCGSELSVAYEPKNLILPTENGVYADNMRCKWKIKRPMLGGITFTFKKLDMETTESCDYDYVVITSRDVDSVKELDEATHLIRYCQKDQINSEHQINYDQYAFVYFISDRTRGFSGFTLEYKIGCRTFEYIEASRGIFDIVHDSPSYPNTYRQAYHCLSGMVLESNRDVNITVVDMDLAPRNSSGKCDIDALSISDMPMSMRSEKKVNEICGQEKFNFTAKSGRIFIQFDSSASSTARRGYRLRVQEIIHDCGSQIIHVDEHTKYYELTSPEYPHVAPNSLDCRWILSVPPGHQVKFTVDPSTFNLMNSNNMTCDDDYMEIYDGASAGSPLIGRYCNQYGPSTIISSNSHLFVRFTTDYYVQSWGWRANVSLASCGGSLVLRPEQNATIRSPNFPLYYPSHETCEWHIRPPKAHIIHAHFNYMYLFYSENCTQDSVSIREVNSTGRELLSPSCMLRQLDSPDFYTSDMAYIRFKSNSTSLTQNRMFCPNKKCGFELEFSLEKQECGGLITDDEGVRYMHTKNDKVIPGLSCRFDFRAGIGNRYRIEFFFVNEDDEEHGFYHRWNPFYKNNEMDWCFPDLDIWNGPQENRYSYYLSSYRFCKNQTIFVSSTDILSMAYEDRLPVYEEQRSEGLYNLNKSRQYQPFGFRYQKVDQDFDSKSCMFHITENSNITIANMSYYIRSNEPSDNSNTFCHIRIDNPHRTMTVHLAFKDFRAGRRDMNWCSTNDNRVRITDSATASWPIDELLCTSRVKNGTIDFTYTTPLLEIFVSNNPFTYTGSYDTTVRFNLTVSYHACGGHINSEFSGNSGRIQSPGTYRGNYTSNADCLWILEAPEGQVVSLNITRLDLEFVVDCNNDFLEISEGQDRHAVIVRLCHEEEPRSDFQLQDRFRTYKSHGRYMTLYFHSNAEIERRGFELKWEFTHFDNGTCGFTAHSETGVVHSPNYPLDYPNNAQCQWFIIVPPGFHIRLIFTYFDVETSLQCYKDKVNITQEHNSREYDPLVTYYFYYDHEEAIGGSLCGTDLPKPIETEANQLRVYFSSDAQTTGRGFEMQWQAVCGTTYRLNHGVISSPHHPKYYPNEDMDCNYLIDPETDGKVQIITLRVVEADLDDTLVTTKRRCNADFLEITDVTQRRVVMTICGNSFNAGSSSNVISIKGPIGVRFVSNSSVMHEKRKNHRGFRITYATADCGGEINLAEAQNRLSNTISSPGFPLPYHDSLDCVWNVTAPVGYVIAVKFTAINLEESDNCIFDYVELYDGPTLSNETSFGRLCGPVSPHGHRVTTSNHAILHFVSDSSSNANGFFAVFTATLGEDSGCGGNLNATENWQTLIPPLDANGNYHNNLRCLWKINTIDPTGRRIQLRINDFNLETRRRTNQSNLCYDFLAVYDGYKTISPFLIRPMCELPNNAELPLHYTSSFYKVEVYFETDNSDAFTGFNISYRTLNNSESCDGLYYPKTEEAEITYEGEKTLTRTNQQHKRCRYFFVVDTKEPMEITFKSFNFPSRTSDCADEYMEIRNIGASANCQHPACANKNDDMKEAVRFCQNHAPTRWVSKSAFVQIVTSEVLQSEYAASFAFTYKVLDSCNRTITITPGDRWASGRITSPNYPNSYDDNSTCTTEILAPNDQQILLVFKDFVVERAAQSRQPFNRRFGIVYNRYQRYGSIPNSYATCAHDSLTIMYNTSDPMDNGTFCGYYVPPARISSSNIMTLIFRTDGDVSYGGYSANYYTARIIEENDYNKFYDFAPIYEIEGVFANIGFPGYNENTTQRWQVVPPAGMDCTFKIVVHMSNTRFCNEDEYSKWVHYEGTTPPTEWTKLPCQDVNMEVKIPSGERAMFEFKSDSNRRNNGMGLKVLWTCIDSTTPVYMIEDTTDSGSRA